MVITGCQKLEDQPFYEPAVPPVLFIAPTTALTPKTEDSTKEAINLRWTYPNHATSPSNIKYVVEIDSVNKNFSNPLTRVLTESLSTSFMFKDINKYLLARKYDVGKPVTLQARVTSSYANNNEPIKSNLLTFSYTPYRELVNYVFPQALYVAGNFQGWNPGTAPKIVDPRASGTTATSYDGYITTNETKTEFKLVKGPAWTAGDFGSAGSGKLSNGGGNLTLDEGAGVYLLRANTADMTWSATKINTWGIIGNATPGDWGSSTRMTLNPNGTYSITTSLKVGELKFRANNDWPINFGDNKANNGPDNIPDYNGDNIAIATAGTYEITLDLTLAGNYRYNIKKL